MLLFTSAPVDVVDVRDAVRVLSAGVASLVIVIGAVPVARRIALTKGITDNPRRDRWHNRPTPYLGGAALVLGVLVACSLLPRWNTEAAVLVLGAVVLAVVGLVDDFRNVPVAVRLLLEAGVAGAAFFAGARVQIFNGGIDFVLTVGWLVVVTNAFNLLDNMDGGVASIAAVVSGGIATVALADGQVLVGGLAVVTGAACIGFLFFNWHPAQIFMGDAGSMFLGFMLGVTALLLRPTVSHFASATGLVLLLSPALFDTVLVVISRVHAGRSVLVGGTDHTSHRLMRLGFGQHETAAMLAAASTAPATIGVLVVERRVHPVVAGLVVGIGWVGATVALLRVPVYHSSPSTPVDSA